MRLGSTGPPGLCQDQLQGMIPDSSRAAAAGSIQQSSHLGCTSDGASKRQQASHKQSLNTASQNNRHQSNPMAFSHMVAEAVNQNQVPGYNQSNSNNFDMPQTKNSTLSSPPARVFNSQGLTNNVAVASAVQSSVMEVHHSQLREAQRMQRQT